ncbi:hypothetical protein RND81_10G082600 [Saponaria officinalis]|uniref:CUE domain-containing protein n=1 Tax=Saponaria officinalis TaxID=3572 RepID=A0AAW1I210_SAPOF
MKTNTSTLNPNAASYVPLAKREVQDVDKERKTLQGEAAVDDLKLKDHLADAAYDTRTVIPQEMYADIMDEESEMDLDYLQMMFPGVSNQFLADVYNINHGDIEAAVDMISELESTDYQPDALNNNEAPEPVSSAECLPVTVASVTDESSTSSGPSGVTVATS